MGWLDENLPQEVVESSLFRFQVTLPDGQKLSIDLAKEVEVSSENFVEELKRTSAHYAFYAAVYSELKSMCTIQEKKIKRTRSEIMKNFLKQRKLTDKQLTAAIDGDEEVIREEIRLSVLYKQTGKVYHQLEALKIKAESMRSLTGLMRNEFYLSKDQT